MKLRFTIHYRTEWGQQLVACVKYSAADGTEKRVQLPMTTQDGDHWSVETVAIESRRSPIESFTYYYIVADAEGRELRREWMGMSRQYAFDSTRTFIFNDQWHDIPLNSHLYSAAYKVTDGMWKNDEDTGITAGSTSMKLPLFRKTLLFRVSAPQLTKNQAVAVVGSHPALGSWNPARYMPMEHSDADNWTATLNVDWIVMPLEFKYVVIDKTTHELLAWEGGDNRSVSDELSDGEVMVLFGEQLRLAEKTWRLAGVSIPVFALRSEHSCGVGDFGDLRRFVDWVALTGLKAIQLLPVNDTTLHHQWGDSCPYKLVSAFALHPQYLDLEQLGELKDKRKMTAYHRQQCELNALQYCDYLAVEKVKTNYVRQIFEEKGKLTLDSSEFKLWYESNKDWLEPYLSWKNAKEDYPEGAFVQYHLHKQLKSASDYARSKGIFFKGDRPIGMNQDSAETKRFPEFFHLDMQIGSPPDFFSVQGQNWGSPTYKWEKMEEFCHRRLKHEEQYFDAIRLDHVLGYFRFWEIPKSQVYGTMGHFSPSLPFTVSEIEFFDLPFRKEFLTKPFVNDLTIERLFGIHANYVKETFLVRKPYGIYELKGEVDNQQKVLEFFKGKVDENSVWIRDGLMRLIANVLLLEDPYQPDMYHPRIMAYNEPVFEALTTDERDAYMRLYNNYFYQRHSAFWAKTGYDRLNSMFRDTRMLVCAEDLGMSPACVESVLNALHILTLEIQQMPKQKGIEFAHLDANPIKSVATISTHDLSPLRLWWEENPERVQRFYTTMLQKQGRAPEHLPAHLAEEIIARHLYSPSMLCILSIQDWLAMDSELWNKNPREERINVPGIHNQWKYRMHLTIEELLKADRFNKKVRTMVIRSKR